MGQRQMPLVDRVEGATEKANVHSDISRPYTRAFVGVIAVAAAAVPVLAASCAEWVSLVSLLRASDASPVASLDSSERICTSKFCINGHLGLGCGRGFSRF